MIHTKQAAYRTYVIAARVAKDSIGDALLWDTGDPYHYCRLNRAADADYLIVGGEDHKTGQDADPPHHFDKLEAWTRARFNIEEVTSRWSGQCQEPDDGLAFLGHNPLDGDHVYIITGDSGNGMTHATIGAIIITDQIMGRKNPWAELYRPNRKMISALKTFMKENLNVVCQFKDYVAPLNEIKSVTEVPLGEGAILREGTSLVAVYRDLEGQVHKQSAVCSHLGCVVRWNTVEKSWDCPCHGSRFSQAGVTLSGPALSDLKHLDR